MATRCPKCGKNNYGDIQKCSHCGSPLVFIPGEEVPEITEEDIQEKMSKVKVQRIRNPLLIGAGGITAVVGFFLMILIFMIMMVAVFNPDSIKPYYNDAWHYEVPGGEEWIFGEITKEVTDEDTGWQGDSAGYMKMTAYEINGDGVDNRANAHSTSNVNLEPHVWIYSAKDLGDRGDRVLVIVEAKPNEWGEMRAVATAEPVWGGKGWISGWVFTLPGLLVLLIGATLLTIGAVGKADRSMERLMEEDKELRRQQLMLREAARKKMAEQQRMQQWQSYSEEQKEAMEAAYPEEDPDLDKAVAQMGAFAPSWEEQPPQMRAQPPAAAGGQVQPAQQPAQVKYAQPQPVQQPGQVQYAQPQPAQAPAPQYQQPQMTQPQKPPAPQGQQMQPRTPPPQQ
ncbi:MAG: hypothetical protein ACMUIE_02785 [Thermoplasmatota archaeon]